MKSRFARPKPALHFLLLIALAAPVPAAAHEPVMLGPLLLGYDLKDLPENPTIQQQIEAGQKQLAILSEGNPSLDSNTEVCDYFNAIVSRLVAASPQPPPFPIKVHVSTNQLVNAQALPGGIIVVYESLFDLADTESALASVLAHETAHQMHDDFLKLWHYYKRNEAVFGTEGALDESRSFESDADLSGAKLMYQAGWDPNGMIAFQVHAHARSKLDVREYQGPWDFYSTHPRYPERLAKLKEFVASLPPKPGLITDSPEFQALKQKY